ncbi:MAG: lysylphosphatidylglycerol synthase transmembrane domain-containing protein [Thermoproteota archaeon]
MTMTSKKTRITWKTILPAVLGLIAFLVYLFVFDVDVPHMLAIVRSVNLPLYSLAVFSIILQTFFFSISWRFLLTFLSVKLSLKKSFLYVWYGIFVDILIPAESISGEISRVYLVTRKQNGTSGKVVASLVTHRLIGTAVNMGAMIISLLVLVFQRGVSGIILHLSLFVVAGTTIILGLVILLIIKEEWTLKVIDAMLRFSDYVTRGKWNLTRFKGKVVEAADMFHDSMREFIKAPKTLSVSLLFSFFSWLLGIFVIYLVFLSMGFTVNWNAIIVTTSMMVAIKGIPLGIPFEAGLPELTMPTIFAALLIEIPSDIRFTVCATATILIRILTVWLRFLIGFTVQQWLGIKAATAVGRESEKLLSETPKT